MESIHLIPGLRPNVSWSDGKIRCGKIVCELFHVFAHIHYSDDSLLDNTDFGRRFVRLVAFTIVLFLGWGFPVPLV